MNDQLVKSGLKALAALVALGMSTMLGKESVKNARNAQQSNEPGKKN